jgi:hypothetical protein
VAPMSFALPIGFPVCTTCRPITLYAMCPSRDATCTAQRKMIVKQRKNVRGSSYGRSVHGDMRRRRRWRWPYDQAEEGQEGALL